MTPMRRYRSEDATILADIYRRSVHAIGPADYSAAQVEAWASLAPSPERIDTLYTDGRTALVAVDGGDLPVAFGDIEADGHIGMLYCTPEAAGTGVAAALCDALELAARRSRLGRIHVEASEAARRFFLKRGFIEISRRDFSIGEVTIQNYAMEKLFPRNNLPGDAGNLPVQN